MPAKIGEIDFKVLSPEMIQSISVVKISRADLYDRDGYPLEGGVMDPRLGVIDPGLRCRTCGGTVGDCPGHFGYLELSEPVVHVRYGKFLHYLLKIICRKCGHVLAEDKELKKWKNPIRSLSRKNRTKCPHCNEKNPKIKFNKPTTYKEGRSLLTPTEIRERLERISDEDLEKLNIRGGRPEWLILTLMPIPPATIRPSITLESGERSEDDLTHKLVDVIRINKRLRENIDIGAPDFIIEDLWELLQYHISTYFDNELTGVPQARHRSGRALKTLTQRLKAKEGRFRGNLAGKRVNFSGRTVVSPDPNLKLNEVGVPMQIATDLTIPEKVTPRNKEYLQDLIKNGEEWPGVNYVLKPDGRKKKVTQENAAEVAEQIENGWTIERHLKDGDVVIFNRQPSLHRMSIMAHKVRVMPYRTFRLNLSVVTPYNADFDGDEMNLHVPQTEEARAEAEMLMDVKTQIRSPRWGGPIIGCIQDHISGAYLLTRKGTEFTREEAYQLLIDSGIDNLELPKKKTITGKELFSLLLPEDINLKYRASWTSSEGKDEESEVIIEKGQLKQGVIDKRGIAAESGILLDRINKEYGDERSQKFIEDISNLAIAVHRLIGFSVSISDTDLKDNVQSKVSKTLDEAIEDCGKFIKQYRDGKLEKIPGRSMKESLEVTIQRRLGEVLNEAEGMIEENIKLNTSSMMARSGARGSMVNITQMSAFVGQETIRGERMERGYHERTLSMFRPNDLSPKARGFVASGYKNGLEPWEFFFDAANSREGLMDTSLKTRQSGYMERRLVNALQDLKVERDGTVRDSSGSIVQFIAGEDNIDPYKSDGGKLNVERIVEKHA